MRILQVRFKNLNSLVGEWEIDLTHPAFATDGIFAITGPTGAGKTTILDAICLALYGRTPRLNKVTKSANEIMSRQTGDCFAEVTFETQAGRYRCHWSQHRAKKKPGGELQAPKHEIADADSGQIFEAKIRGVADQIEAATGMDFDRFTRSMLLAQGGFAVFLQAAADERAPILEQITGTAIYSRISIRVHEFRSEERKKLEVLQAALAGLQLLTPEDEHQLGIILEQKTQQDVELNQQITQKSQAITWIEGINRLEEELKQIGQQKDDLQTRMEAFAPEQERLKSANQALELSGDYSALTSIRREQETDRRSLGENQESLPCLEEAAKLAEAIMKAAAEQLETKKSEQQKALPIIRKVRELDLKIAEKDTLIKATKDVIAECDKSLEVIRTKKNEDLVGLDIRRSALEDLLRLLKATKADEELVEHLTGIRERFEASQNLNGQLVDKHDEINQADGLLQETSQIWQEQSINLDKEKRAFDDIQNSLTEKQAEFTTLLENKELADWRKNQSLLTSQKDLLVKTTEAVQSRLRSKQSIEELDNRKASLSAEKSTLASQLQSLTEKQRDLEKEMGLLETQLTLLKRIEDLEEARHQLQDGEPCPLCGAKEHPFAEGSVPVPDETHQRLAAVRGDLKSVTDAVSDLRVKLAQTGKDLEQVTSGQKELAGNIDDANRLIAQACSDLRPEYVLDASDPGLETKLNGLQDNSRQALEHAARTVQAADVVEKALNILRESLEMAKESVVKAERETQAAVHKKDSAGQLMERLNKEADGYRNQLEKSLVLLQKDVQVFGIENVSIDNLNLVQEQLTARRDQWLARDKEKAELDQKIAALKMRILHQTEQIQMSENELQKQQYLLDGLLRERDTFVREREDLFGDKKPDDEEARFFIAIDSADKELEDARHKLITANQVLSQLKSRIEEFVKAIGTRGIQLKMSEEAFLVRLSESGFSEEGNYTAACLPESERKSLARQSHELSDELTELSSREREKNSMLDTERRKQMTNESLDELNNAQVVLVLNHKELQQEIGGIRQKLKGNESLKQQQQERAQAIDAQKRECSRWDQLHELIGSADGKKYRNFAQGLTFEMMIGHANRQLLKMTDRYLLIRDNSQPLGTQCN